MVPIHFSSLQNWVIVVPLKVASGLKLKSNSTSTSFAYVGHKYSSVDR